MPLANSDSQPMCIAPKFEEVYSFKRDFDLTDLFLFTNGQPYDKFGEPREIPVYFHETS